MLINLRNALMTGKRLPYDAEVEFLESTGTQYIEVPMVVDNSATVNITGYVSVTNSDLFSFDKKPQKQFNIESSATYYRWWTNSPINLGSGFLGQPHSFKCNSSIWVDGVLKGTTTATITGTTQVLYILNGFHGATSGRIDKVSVEYGGALIFDAVPVRKGMVGYLYDRVTGSLFGNAGTGDFILGPEDVVPVNFVDGEAYNSSGAIITAQGFSRIDDYLPVIGGHSVTFNYGGESNSNCTMIVYNSGKTMIDYWSATSNNERTITMNVNGAFARFAVYEESKQRVFLRDNTTGEYIMINGKRVV